MSCAQVAAVVGTIGGGQSFVLFSCSYVCQVAKPSLLSNLMGFFSMASHPEQAQETLALLYDSAEAQKDAL